MKNIRVTFEKCGLARYISHLDLMRAMTRAVRRAEIPLWYTEGFNRHPYLTFAAPLSLGSEGLQETMDLRLEEELPMEELVRRLDAVMPQGLRITGAAEAVHKPGELAAARYQLTFDCPPAVLEALLAQPEILVEKRTKKKTMKTLDIRPAFAGAAVAPAPEGAVMTVTLPLGNDTVTPTLLLTALNAGAARQYRCRVLRLALLLENGEPFC